MKIVTLTLNPAFDIHCYGAEIRPLEENIAKITERDIGGKGVNISRALGVCGTKNLAFLLLGKDNGAELENRLKKEGIECKSIYIPGRVRENITHHSERGETRLSFDGLCVDSESFYAVQEEILSLIGNGDILTLTGSLPEGVSNKSAVSLLMRAKKKGALAVADSRSLTYADLAEAKPWLIKPNFAELRAMTGGKAQKRGEILACAEELYSQGIENVLVSLGSDGAVLRCSEGAFCAAAPKIEAISTIGAGDSMIAGFIYGREKGESMAGALRYAVAFGSAACLLEGTVPPKMCDIIELVKKTEVKRI